MSSIVPGGRPSWPVARVLLDAGADPGTVSSLFGPRAFRLAMEREFIPAAHNPWAPRVALALFTDMPGERETCNQLRAVLAAHRRKAS